MESKNASKEKARRYSSFGEHRTWSASRPCVYKDRKKEEKKYAARRPVREDW